MFRGSFFLDTWYIRQSGGRKQLWQRQQLWLSSWDDRTHWTQVQASCNPYESFVALGREVIMPKRFLYSRSPTSQTVTYEPSN